MRKVKAWLVSDCGGEYEDYWETPVRAFTDRAAADECASKREERGRCLDFIYDNGFCSIHEIEVVLDD